MQRLSGISVDCLVITSEELTQLLWENREQFKKDFDNWCIENEEDIDYEVLDEMWTSLPYASVLHGFNGSFWYRFNKQNEIKRHCDETLYILELQKNSLYEKYEDENELIEELCSNLFNNGFATDDGFILEHFGFLEGVY